MGGMSVIEWNEFRERRRFKYSERLTSLTVCNRRNGARYSCFFSDGKALAKHHHAHTAPKRGFVQLENLMLQEHERR